ERSRYFTITILVVEGVEHNRALINAVKKTCRRKLPKIEDQELKGSRTSFEVKQYFYDLARPIPFEIFSVTLNKRRVYSELTEKKDRVYNFIARKVLDRIPFDRANNRVELIIDRCKSKREIVEFNTYLANQLKGRIDPLVPLDIFHWISHENPGLQAVDLFSWGIFRKHERGDDAWRSLFAEKIRFDDIYLK
ncbi:MAG: hypothetical protein D084_Lepto4C00152G0001, partial [Leptospirillum sp. Group IV 'UBA BS']